MSISSLTLNSISNLYRFQVRGGEWLAESYHRYLADHMGIGKTRQIAYAASLVEPRNALVLCPAKARGRWAEDWKLIFPAITPTILSYDQVVKHGVPDGTFDVLALDEFHRCKSRAAKRSKLILGKEGLFKRCGYVWPASGSPAPNHPGELYTGLARLWPDRLRKLNIRNYKMFLDFFTKYQETEWSERVTKARNTPILKELLFGGEMFGEAIMLRRTWESEEILAELPPMAPLVWRDESVTVEPKLIRELLDPELNLMMLELADQLDAGMSPHISGEMMRIKHLVGILKAPAVAETLAEDLEDDPSGKVVVMAYHQDVLTLLRNELARFGVVQLDGSTSPAMQEQVVRQFQGDPKTRVFLGQIVSCRESLTLTAASRVELVEPDWAPDYNEQAASRIRRHGQKARHLQVRIWGLAETFDDNLARLLARKARMKAETIS